MAESMRVSVPQLEAFIARALEAVDIPAADARIIGELMTRADVQGSEGHGVFRLPQYVRRIKGGAVNTRPYIRVMRDARGDRDGHREGGRRRRRMGRREVE